MSDYCRPVYMFKDLNFWIGLLIGGIVTLLVGKFMGWLVF